MSSSLVLIKNLLLRFKPQIGKEYDKYKNHVYRVYFNCLLMDASPLHTEKYAIAAVFHDIGIWTDHTIDYLEPSIAQVQDYLQEENKQSWTDEISHMIRFHHKVSHYQGPYEKTVETFRRADWIDVSLGLLTFQANKEQVMLNRIKYPNLGFHLFLIKEVGKNFFRRPFNPLPMFKS